MHIFINKVEYTFFTLLLLSSFHVIASEKPVRNHKTLQAELTHNMKGRKLITKSHTSPNKINKKYLKITNEYLTVNGKYLTIRNFNLENHANDLGHRLNELSHRLLQEKINILETEYKQLKEEMQHRETLILIQQRKIESLQLENKILDAINMRQDGLIKNLTNPNPMPKTMRHNK